MSTTSRQKAKENRCRCPLKVWGSTCLALDSHSPFTTGTGVWEWTYGFPNGGSSLSRKWWCLVIFVNNIWDSNHVHWPFSGTTRGRRWCNQTGDLSRLFRGSIVPDSVRENISVRIPKSGQKRAEESLMHILYSTDLCDSEKWPQSIWYGHDWLDRRSSYSNHKQLVFWFTRKIIQYVLNLIYGCQFDSKFFNFANKVLKFAQNSNIVIPANFYREMADVVACHVGQPAKTRPSCRRFPFKIDQND